MRLAIRIAVCFFLVCVPGTGAFAQSDAPTKVSPALRERAAREPGAKLLVHIVGGSDAAYRAKAEIEKGPAISAVRTAPPATRLQAVEQERAALAARIAALAAPVEDAVSAEVDRLGGQVLGRDDLTTDVVAIVPANALAELAALPQVREIVADEKLQGGLNISGPAINAPSVWNLGFIGAGVKVGLLDSGMHVANPALSGASIQSNFYLNAAQTDSCWADQLDTDDHQGHGTHVGGIVVSQGASQCPNCLGIARGSSLLNIKTGFKCSTSTTPSTFWADVQAGVAGNRTAAVYNLSYGNKYTCDGNASLGSTCDDSAMSRWWDTNIDTYDQLATICAGNNGTDGPTSIWAPAIAYNVLAVGNVNDAGTTTRADDTMNSSSGVGPTAGGRKKPDISAPGSFITSTNYLSDSGTQFVSYTGTSMAAPHVAGTIALLLDASAADPNTTLLDPRAMKAVLINSAETKSSSGWDAHWGWGYLDAYSAYLHRNAVLVDAADPAPAPAHDHLYVGSTNGTAGKATLVWHRHPNYSYTCPSGTLILNNLDLYAYNEADGSQLAASTSTVDNVEQVVTPGYSSVVLRVTDLCTTFGAGPHETYAVATEPGFQRAYGPQLWAGVPLYLLTPGQTAQVSVEAGNSGDLTAQNVQVTLTLPVGFVLVSGANPQNVGAISPRTKTNASWTVTVPSAAGIYSATGEATSASYGENFSASGSGSWNVGTADIALALTRPARPARTTQTTVAVSSVHTAAPAVVRAGGSLDWNLTLGGAPSFSLPVALSCEAPKHVECKVSPATADLRENSDISVTIVPDRELRAGKHSVTVKATAGGRSRSLRLPFVVRRND